MTADVPILHPPYLVFGWYVLALRRARRETHDTVARRIGTTAEFLRSIEKGRVSSVNGEMAADLLRGLGITGADAEAIADLLDQVDSLHDGAPGALERLACCERQASRIRIFASHAVPALAQTPGYAEAVAARVQPRRPGSTHLELTRHLHAGDEQSAILLLDEAVLHRPVGGSKVMADQLAHLQDLTDKGLAEVRILPLAAQVCIPSCLFSELVLHGATQRLYVEESMYVTYIAGPTGVQVRLWLDRIEAATLSPSDSYAWLTKAHDRWAS